MSRQRRRERILTHTSEDEKEDVFLGLKTQLEVLSDLDELYGDDPQIQRNIFAMKQKMKRDV